MKKGLGIRWIRWSVEAVKNVWHKDLGDSDEGFGSQPLDELLEVDPLQVPVIWGRMRSLSHHPD